jgi:putative ABC transport system permease protein
VRQIFVVTALNFRSLRSRLWPSLVIIVGMACVVGVLLSMLSLSAGLFQAFDATGSADRIIITSREAGGENASNIPRASLSIIRDAPGIRKDTDGQPMVDPTVLSNTPVIGKEKGTVYSVSFRGWGAKGVPLRPEIKLIEGRMFQSGKREFIVGVGARAQYKGLELGDMVTMPDGEWPIVGVFEAGKSTLNGNLLTDVETAMAAVRRNYFSGVYVGLDPAPGSFEKLKKALTTNPALSVQVERHSEYYARTMTSFAFLNIVAYSVGIIMAIGALFGALNTMYSAVSTRTREIATLRALGFGALPVAISVITEAMLLALVGAALGAAIAWLLYDGAEHVLAPNIFRLTVPAGNIAMGLIWAIIIALVGGLFPSIRAARLPIATGLRAT